jgi:putative phosphoribosyl transferase
MMNPPPARRTGAVNSLLERLSDPPLPDPPYDELPFADRRDAGRRLAVLLERFRDEHPVVVGLPRGGVPVAAEVARALSAPLDVVVVRKVGAPKNPEFAIGALAEGGTSVVDQETVDALGIAPEELRVILARAHHELDRRIERYRGQRAPLVLEGRTVLLVDDGLATGHSAHAAAQSVYQRGAARVILAVPVAAPLSVRDLLDYVDDIVTVEAPADTWAIGFWYEDFRPTSDEEVAALLDEFGASEHPVAREVEIDAETGVILIGDLIVPPSARGVVAFAHGSGSSRLSPRNGSVARALNDASIGTLLFDLLTATEEIDRTNVFDIPLLAKRLLAATHWLGEQPETSALPLGYFGASTGAAAALIAAADAGEKISAVVSRGGRPDLAIPRLHEVTAPTLLIVGEQDWQVLDLNREAQEHLRCPNRLTVVPRATHLFEEPGALEEVSRLAIDWFQRHLLAPPSPAELATGTARS